MKLNPQVDQYIANAAPFAQPLLEEMRQRIQKALPDAVEIIKWRVPFYEVGGKIVASMAAFKAHTKFGVWQGMRPHMVDVRVPAELPPAAAYAAELKTAAAAILAGSTRAKAKETAAKKAKPSAAATKKAPKKAASKAAKQTAGKRSASKQTAGKKVAKKPAK